MSDIKTISIEDMNTVTGGTLKGFRSVATKYQDGLKEGIIARARIVPGGLVLKAGPNGIKLPAGSTLNMGNVPKFGRAH